MSLIRGSEERPFTQLTRSLCFLFIANSIAKLWLLLLPQVDRPETLPQVHGRPGLHDPPSKFLRRP